MKEQIAATFERDRPRLLRIARRILRDPDQAEEIVQESWLKAELSPEQVRNASAWFTTIVTRSCIDRLRQQQRRSVADTVELDDTASDPNETALIETNDPEQALLKADSIGVALLVVLERLSPLERVAFVLHDVFDFQYEEIASLIDRSHDATRQLASRARRRVHGAPPTSTDIPRHRALAEAFLAAARRGDVQALLEILDPEVVLTGDQQAVALGVGTSISGAEQVARFFSGRAVVAHVAMINGQIGIIVAPGDQLVLVVIPSFAQGRIASLQAIATPKHLARLSIRLAFGPAYSSESGRWPEGRS